MSTYYIERHIPEGNCWRMITIENTQELAIEIMNSLRADYPNSTLRVVMYVDTAPVSMWSN